MEDREDKELETNAAEDRAEENLQSEQVPESEPDREREVNPEQTPEADSETGADAELETGEAAAPESEPEREAEAEAQAEQEADGESDPEGEPNGDQNEAGPEGKPKAEAEVEPETESEEKPKEKPQKDPKSYRWIKKLGKLIVKIAVLMIIGSSLWTWVGNIYITHDNNMYPHIKDGDLVVTYKLKPYINGDAVLFETEKGLQIGRIIARDGDVVELAENGLFTVNGSVPYENIFYDTYPAADSQIRYPYTVPEGEYFILNDMREQTKDSRVFGAVPEEALLGKIEIIVRHRGM